MTSLFSRLDRTARRLPDAVLMAIAVAILFLLAAIKVSTAWHDVPIVDFFLVPVASMAWLARSRGHEVGDRLLASIGHAMACSVRSTDLVARVGGDEFVALMPETDRLAAGQVARRARAELARVRMPDGRSARCSIGVVTLSSPPASVDELIHHADDLMYRAKQRGKDAIESAQVASTPS